METKAASAAFVLQVNRPLVSSAIILITVSQALNRARRRALNESLNPSHANHRLIYQEMPAQGWT
jgi:hypothetical protein